MSGILTITTGEKRPRRSLAVARLNGAGPSRRLALCAEYDELGLIMRAVCVIVSFTLGSTGRTAFHRYRSMGLRNRQPKINGFATYLTVFVFVEADPRR